jgi:uncharacterized protein with PQ loop repeat
MNAYIELLGFVASVMSFILWWPQAALVWRCRGRGEQLTGVSISSQLLLLINACLWGAYAVGTGSLWVGAPGLVNGPLAVITIVLLRRARHELHHLPARTLPLHEVQARDR